MLLKVKSLSDGREMVIAQRLNLDLKEELRIVRKDLANVSKLHVQRKEFAEAKRELLSENMSLATEVSGLRGDLKRLVVELEKGV